MLLLQVLPPCRTRLLGNYRQEGARAVTKLQLVTNAGSPMTASALWRRRWTLRADWLPGHVGWAV